MPYRPGPVQPRFADLKGTLAQTKRLDHALYQTIQILLERLDQMQFVNAETFSGLIDDISDILANMASKFATYATIEDETLELPNSRQLIAGTNIVFDTTTPGQMSISVPNAGVPYMPLTLGDEPPTFVTDGAGRLIMLAFTP